MSTAPGTLNLRSTRLRRISTPPWTFRYLYRSVISFSFMGLPYSNIRSPSPSRQTPNLLKTMLSRYANTVDNTLRTVTPTPSCGCDILWNEHGSLLQLISGDAHSCQVRFSCRLSIFGDICFELTLHSLSHRLFFFKC